MSQEAFAATMHVAFSTVNRWENKKAEPNSIARAFIADYCEKHSVDTELIAAIRNKGR